MSELPDTVPPPSGEDPAPEVVVAEAAVVPQTGGSRRPPPWWFAAIQVFMVCGVPTQVIVVIPLLVFMFVAGQPLPTGAQIPLEFLAVSSLLDTALVAVLLRVFLALSGETSRDVFIGRRPIWGEAWRGMALLPVVLVVLTGVVYGIRALLPWLHNVEENPFEQYMNSPLDVAILLVVVVIAGGVREELARGFILHRFDQRLGGARVGLIVFSIVFGLQHFNQGFDVALAVGLLGLLWGILYIRRRSVVAPMVNHACFDVVQVLAGALLK